MSISQLPKKLKENIDTLIEHKKYSFDKRPNILGEGSFGTVVQAEHRSKQDGSRLMVAVKIAKQRDDKLTDRSPNLKEEYAKLKKITSFPDKPIHIVAAINRAAIVDRFSRHTQYICLELCSGGSIADWMTERPLPMIKIEAVRQVLVGLEYLHSKGMYHRDIKPENLLLYQSETAKGGYIAKIGGFGLAEEGRVSKVLAGTLGCLPPEMMISCKAYDLEKQDVFTIGCFVYWLGSKQRRLPWNIVPPFDSAHKWTWLSQRQWMTDRGIPTTILDMLTKTLNFDPAKRDTAVQLLRRSEAMMMEKNNK